MRSAWLWNKAYGNGLGHVQDHGIGRVEFQRWRSGVSNLFLEHTGIEREDT